jgi:hypothetical protein
VSTIYSAPLRCVERGAVLDVQRHRFEPEGEYEPVAVA